MQLQHPGSLESHLCQTCAQDVHALVEPLETIDVAFAILEPQNVKQAANIWPSHLACQCNAHRHEEALALAVFLTAKRLDPLLECAAFNCLQLISKQSQSGQQGHGTCGHGQRQRMRRCAHACCPERVSVHIPNMHARNNHTSGADSPAQCMHAAKLTCTFRFSGLQYTGHTCPNKIIQLAHRQAHTSLRPPDAY